MFGRSSKIPRSSSLSRNSIRPSTSKVSSEQKNAPANRNSVRPSLRRSNSSTSLQVPKLSIRRSNSSNNLFLTPAQTPLRSKSPKTDKKSQMEDFHKLKAFLLSKDPNIGDLRPPSIQSFITAFNLLFKEFSPNYPLLTKADYQEKIPLYLKNVMCPYTLPRSTFKSIGAQHSFNAILSVWLWLYDFSLKINHPEELLEDLYPNLNHTLRTLVIEACYKLFNKGRKEDEIAEEFSNSLKMSQEFKDLPTKKLEAEYKSLKKDHQEVLQQAEELNSELDVIKIETESIRQMKEEIENNYLAFRGELDRKLKTLSETKAPIENAIQLLTKMIAEMKEKIQTQPCSKEEEENLTSQKKALEQMEAMKLSQLKEVELTIQEQNKIKNRLNDEIMKKIISENCNITKLAIDFPDLKLCKIPESCSPDSFHAAYEIENKLNAIQNQLEKEKSACLENIEALQSSLKNQNIAVEDALFKIKKLNSEIIEIEQQRQNDLSMLEQVESLYKERDEEYKKNQALFKENFRKVSFEVNLLEKEIEILKEETEQSDVIMIQAMPKLLKECTEYENKLSQKINMVQRNVKTALETRRERFEKLCSTIKKFQKHMNSE